MAYANKDDYRRYQRAYQKERKRKLRLAVTKQLGGKCVDCGETDPTLLEFDFIEDNSQKTHVRINCLLRLEGGLNNPRLQEELSKCQLRCSACHAVKDGRLVRDKWGDFKREGKNSWKNGLKEEYDEVPF